MVKERTGFIPTLQDDAIILAPRKRIARTAQEEAKLYYRVAIQVDASPTWKWKSTPLSSLNILIHWLQYYRVLPLDRLRIFSSRSQEELNEQLVRENQGLGSPSVPATQFLQERRIAPQGVGNQASIGVTRANERMAPVAALSELSLAESSVSPLDRRREELERGAGGDHDLPYRFTLLISTPQVLAWLKLQVRVQQGDLQTEVVAFGSGNSVVQGVFRVAPRVSNSSVQKL
jgi:hypothetical protein